MLTPGTQLGRYEIRERLGAGGMGIVFRAHDAELGRDVAIKILPEEFAADSTRVSRFAREARAASALNHPNIVTIHEIGEAGTQPYIVMELVDGRTLREMIGPRPLPARRVLDLGSQLADGLAKAHAAGVVHRDLKPENVIVSRDGVVKIVDFGLSRPAQAILSASGSGATEAETREGELRTQPGAILGTVGYMAPEQARGELADHRADQFALGAILYEMATARRAFRRESAVQTLADIIDKDPDPIEVLNPEFPAPARWAIQRCLAKDPAERYASTRDLAGELRTIRDHLAETAGSGAVVAARPGPRPRRLRAWQAIVFGAIVVAGVLAGPAAWRAWRSWIAGPPLPEVLRVAVLPVGGSPEVLQSWGGLFEYVVSRLAELHRQDARLSVVPASEIVDANCRTPSAASRAVNATVVVEIRVNRVSSGYQVSVGISDPQQLLTSEVRGYDAPSPQQVVELVVRLLRLQLDAPQRAAWSRSGPSSPGADVLLAQALQETPYQQARTAAERFDQVQSLQKAIGLYNKAIDTDPGYAAARAGLGEAYLRLYSYTRDAQLLALARQSLERAVQLDDTRPAAWMSLGMLHTLSGDTARAEDALANAVRRNPSGGEIHRELGAAYERAGLGEKAETAFREAVRLQPDSWANHNYLGRFLVGRGQYEEAEREFVTALQLVPDNARVLSNLGGLYLALARWDEALRALTHALEVNPASGPALSNIGTLHYSHHRDYRAAAEYFGRASAASPRDYRVWYNLGLAREAVPGLQAEAAEAYRRAAGLLRDELAVDGSNPRLLVRLADCLAALGEAAESRQLIAAALQRRPGAEDLRIAAKAEEQLGHRDAALALLKRAFDAGLNVATVEGASPTLAELRKDPRYAALVKSVRSRAGNRRES